MRRVRILTLMVALFKMTGTFFCTSERTMTTNQPNEQQKNANANANAQSAHIHINLLICSCSKLDRVVYNHDHTRTRRMDFSMTMSTGFSRETAVVIATRDSLSRANAFIAE